MIYSRTLSITVNRKIGDTFDAILNCPPKLMPDATKSSDGWWSFSTPRGIARLKFKENKSYGVLDHTFIDEESKWNVPMRIVSNGDESEVFITLIKPDEITPQQFNERVIEIGQVFENLKKLIES